MTVTGRDVLTDEPVEIEFRDGRIAGRRILGGAMPGGVTKGGGGPDVDGGGRTGGSSGVIPETLLSTGWIDLQVNGWKGTDYNSDDITRNRLEAMCLDMGRHGTTRHLATVITAPAGDMLRRIARIRSLREESPFLARRIIGIHVEGPFLSSDDGPRGAHSREAVRDPSPAEFDAWQEAAGGLIRIVTLAPERPGASDLIRHISSCGVIASIGHTDADPSIVKDAVAAGARMSTHLGNGLAATIHRHRNPLWEQISSDRLSASLICDGHHLPPAFIRTVCLAKGPRRIVLVSDVTSPGGLPPGRQTWAGMDVEVNTDGRVSLSGTPYLAGAGHLLDRGIAVLMTAAGWTAAGAVGACTEVPAALIGLPHFDTLLEPGSPGDVVAFGFVPTSGDVLIRDVWLDGEPIGGN